MAGPAGTPANSPSRKKPGLISGLELLLERSLNLALVAYIVCRTMSAAAFAIARSVEGDSLPEGVAT